MPEAPKVFDPSSFFGGQAGAAPPATPSAAPVAAPAPIAAPVAPIPQTAPAPAANVAQPGFGVPAAPTPPAPAVPTPVAAPVAAVPATPAPPVPAAPVVPAAPAQAVPAAVAPPPVAAVPVAAAPVVAPVQAAPVVAPVQAAPVVAAVPAAAADAPSFAKTHAITFGDKLSRYPVPRFRGIKGFTKRIGILNVTKWYAVKTHYEQGIGYYFCFGTVCCESNDPSVRYLAPMVAYDTDKDGNIVSPNFEIQYMALSDQYYDHLQLIHRNYPLDEIDMLAMCADETYQKMAYQPAGAASWKQNAEWGKAIVEKYQELEPNIMRCHATRLGRTPDECVKALAARRSRGSNQPTQTQPTPTAQAPGVAQFDMNAFMNQPGGDAARGR